MIRVRRGADLIGRVEPKGQWAIPAVESFVDIYLRSHRIRMRGGDGQLFL